MEEETKTERASIAMSGVIDVKIPKDADTESMNFSEYQQFIEEHIDWSQVVNQLHVDIEPL